MDLSFPENIFKDLEFSILEITPEMTKRLDEIFKRLSPIQDDILRLRYECGDSWNEIAEELHKTRGQILRLKEDAISYIKTFKRYICTGKDDSHEEEELLLLQGEVLKEGEKLQKLKEITKAYEEKLAEYYRTNLKMLENLNHNLSILMGEANESSTIKEIHEKILQIKKEEEFSKEDLWKSITLKKLFDNGSLSSRAVNSLSRAGIRNLYILSKITMQDFRRIPNLGKKTRQEIMDLLDSYGILVLQKPGDWKDTLILFYDYPGTYYFLEKNDIHTYSDLITVNKTISLGEEKKEVIDMYKDVCNKVRYLVQK